MEILNVIFAKGQGYTKQLSTPPRAITWPPSVFSSFRADNLNVSGITHNHQFNSAFEYTSWKRDEVEGIEALKLHWWTGWCITTTMLV
jgi:hypothetical protein